MGVFILIALQIPMAIAIAFMILHEPELIAWEQRKIQNFRHRIGKYDCKIKKRGKNNLTNKRLCGKIAMQSKERY